MKRIVKGLIGVSLALSSQSLLAGDLNSKAEEYVKLVLAVGQHDKYYVDAYYGPEKWAEEAKVKKIPLDELRDRAISLQQKIGKPATKSDEVSNLRHHYLYTQLTAVISHIKALSGEKKMSFDEQANNLYDTQPPHIDFSEFDKALAKLDNALPGEGSLLERVEAFDKKITIPSDKLTVVMDEAIKECRNRTKEFVELLPNESFDLEFVNNQPWSGYNWYKGKAHSLIQINTDHPIGISRAVDLGCHEGYPGHHTYNALLESNLTVKRGWQEFSVYPLFSPQSLIAEGSANYGIQMAFPGKERVDYEKNVLFPLAGIDAALAETYYEVSTLRAKLNYAGNEVARLYLNGDINKEQAASLFRKYSVSTQAKSEQRIGFMDRYGAYVINYNWGKDLVKRFVESDPEDTHQQRWQKFRKLLSSPRLPSSLNW